ncbi:TetR family transcriptional regulator [Shewanella algicola]|jgi:TetR/AcrR family transcriptional repressor of nem operon|uniref:TetR/AcrR family transcriptional regulator n=2 Tax=Shewanellaceae TaxID=267890 RepID=A0A9X1ZF87_9GAMM|nr:TetR/AcrR family transcriptional regulator [Shewanella algicola]MCL1107630.1 TetR/AcrR family transcriptional regulator [Shewanella algicola]GGP70973.1 TetR family transcriptional regulator [Shewanella algicola]|tara:strand:+ start:1609 stop:2214 length:606 start_codon:yes stop_codon:yes gene_type:complete
MGRKSDSRQHLQQAILDLMWETSYGTLTIDLICERAGVKKGSFYYFFNSKSELAAEAISWRWEAKKAKMDTLFSHTRTPLERLKLYFDDIRNTQLEALNTHGRILGCPNFSVGAEISGTAPELDKKLKRTFTDLLAYIESAIRDAQLVGDINVTDPAMSARCVLAFFEGVLTHAQVLNDPTLLDDIWPGTLQMLGVVSTSE